MNSANPGRANYNMVVGISLSYNGVTATDIMPPGEHVITSKEMRFKVPTGSKMHAILKSTSGTGFKLDIAYERSNGSAFVSSQAITKLNQGIEGNNMVVVTNYVRD